MGRSNNNNNNNNDRRGNKNAGHFGGAKIVDFSRGEVSSCGSCNAITACFHGFHKYFGDKEFFKLLNARINGRSEDSSKKKKKRKKEKKEKEKKDGTDEDNNNNNEEEEEDEEDIEDSEEDDNEEEDEDEDDENDDDDDGAARNPNAKMDKLVRHMFGVVCEMLEFYYSDEESHVFEHSATTQERIIVHSLCTFFGFVSNSVGFHPKRRVHVAKIANGGRFQDIYEIPVGRIRSIARSALRNNRTISSLEQRDSKMKRKTGKEALSTARSKKDKEGDDDDDDEKKKKKGEGVSESENESEQEDGSPQKKRPRMVHQTQTGLEEPLDLGELKERVRIQVDQELQHVATGGELIEKLGNIEREISENYSVASFEHLRHGSFVSFLSANADLVGGITVGGAGAGAGDGGGAQDPLLSRLPSAEELREYVAQYAAHHDTKDVSKVAESALAQFDVPFRCYKDVYAQVDAALKAGHAQAGHMKRLYLRAYLGESAFPGWSPEKPLDRLPLGGAGAPPMLGALAWGRLAGRANVSSADAAAALEGADLVFLDGGAAVKRTEGKGLSRAIAAGDAWTAVSELVSLVLGNDGRIPIELCSQQCADGFAGMGRADHNRFLLDFLKLLPPVLYETTDGTIKSAVIDPFVDVFGRLDASFFPSVADPGDKEYSKCALSLLGVDVTGYVDHPSIPDLKENNNDNNDNININTNIISNVSNNSDVVSDDVSNVISNEIKVEEVKKESLDDSWSGPRGVIEDIRRYEFGIGVKTDERTQKTLQAQYEREARAIERLSSELYTRDSHFFLELLQNADDNRYPSAPGFCPTLELEFTPATLIVRNNELGFSERDVRAICDIANSTKSSSKRAEVGQTGEKGIGFKAVFRVSDKPQIHSNGYHFEFDAESEPVRFIVPRWVGADGGGALVPQDGTGTTILLPWRKDIAHKVGLLFNHVTSMNAETLLFLRRLSKVVVKNAATGEERTISREIQPVSPEGGASLVRIRVGAAGASTWLVVERKLAPQVARKGAPVSQTALSLGFRLTEEAEGQGAYAAEYCSVCALLPLCASRFRFIIQGDFVSSASREGLDEDVAWNQWLRGEVPDAFVHAVRTAFLGAPTELRYTWYAFVPMPRDGTGLFASVPAEIARKLAALECVLAEDGAYVVPKRALLVPDAVRRLFPQAALDAAFGGALRYCHPRISASCAGVLQLLGAQPFEVSHLVALLSRLGELPGARDDAWFHDLFAFLCDYAEPVLLRDSDAEKAFYDGLKSARFIPTEGPSCNLEDPASAFLMKQDEDYGEDVDMDGIENNNINNNNNNKFVSDTDSKMVRFSVLRSFDPVLRSKVVSLLRRLGVRTYSEHEHVLKHVVPGLPELESEDAILAKTMAVYRHWKSCSICLSDSRSLSRKLYNGLPVLLLLLSSSTPTPLGKGKKKKFCFLKDACVHFRPRFPADAPGGELWNVLSDVYPAHLRDFFEFVGVRDSLGVYPEQQVVALEGESPTWHGVALPPALGGSYRVDDYASPEFHALVGGFRSLPQPAAAGAMEQLVRICEDDWLVLSKFVTAKLHYLDPATGNELSLDAPSSFATDLRTKKWILSGERDTDGASKEEQQQNRFRAPSALFIDSAECAEFTGEIGPYPKVPMSDSFAREIGVRFAVTPDDALALLRRWAKSGKTGQTRAQMEAVYRRAAESPAAAAAAPKDPAEALIFDPTGKRYVPPAEAFWDDPSGAFVSLVDAGYAPEMRDVFVGHFGVRLHPEPEVYIRMLDDLTGTPREDAARAAFGVFAHFGRLVEEGVLTAADRRWRKLAGKVVFPTTTFHWVSVKDKIYVNDIASFDSCPSLKGLFYMYLPPKHRLRAQGIGFVSVLGVKRISEVLSLRTVTSDLEPDNELLEFVRDNLSYIQRFVKKRHPDVYAARSHELAEVLPEFRAFTASELSGVWCVDNSRETHPIPYKALLCECVLYYRRSKSVYRYDKCVLSELAKLFLGEARDTTVMAAFLDTLARDADSEEFGAKMEEYIGPDLEDGEVRWEIHLDESEKPTAIVAAAESPDGVADAREDSDPKEENSCGIQVISNSNPDAVMAPYGVENQYEGMNVEQANSAALGAQNPAAGRTLNTLDDEEKRRIGDRGEKIVYDILRKEYPHDTVVWCNEGTETGLPYDLVVSDANGSNKRFIEVKATKTADKSFFEVSFREWMFSHEHKGKFFIYRVFDALGDDPKILKIQNPFKEWSMGNLGMLLYIKDTANQQN